MVDGLIDRMEAELGRPTTVVATGEWHGSCPLCRHEIALERDLQLKGWTSCIERTALRKRGGPRSPVKEKGDCRKKRLCRIFEKASVNRAQGLTACGRELCEAFPS